MTRILICAMALILGLASLVQAGTLSATLTWTDSDNADAVEIDKAPASSGPWTRLTTVPAGTLTYVDATNDPGTAPCYRVENVNSSGTGPVSNVACKTFPPLPTVAPVLGPIQ